MYYIRIIKSGEIRWIQDNGGSTHLFSQAGWWSATEAQNLKESLDAAFNRWSMGIFYYPIIEDIVDDLCTL